MTSKADESGTGIRHRLRLIAGCLFLTAVAFNTMPERILSETKVDMAVDPVGFLSRALYLWDDSYFGHLQNQAYGYLFPMGPFYAAGLGLGIPAWNVQRMWMALVLCAAFVGAVHLLRALRIGNHWTRLVAGLAYALAPHAQALVGINSSEFLPSAVLPWIMLPLVHGARGRWGPRRAALLSAAALLFAGGVNAAAELAVLVIPLIYLLTRRGPGRLRMLLWWLPAVALASTWWLASLVLLGRYIFSFLPYIETAGAVTSVTSLANVLRGTSSWLGFLRVDGRDWVPASAELSTHPWLIAATLAVAALGLAGLAARRNPERAFLLITLLVGVAVVSAGHVTDLATPLTPALRELFDGPLAAFRNLHKFDALVRLPLVAGLAMLLAQVKPRRVVVPVTAALVGVTMLPVAAFGLSTGGSFWNFPDHWQQAGAWLDEHAGEGLVLAVPGSRRGEYDWGRPLDEPMQSLLKKARWATSSNMPWGSAGVSRLLRAIDERFAGGQGSEGLTTVLRRMGVRYLLVRNDLDRATITEGWPARVHEAIEESPGLFRVGGYGKQVGIPQHTTASGWIDQPYDALEIYEVAGTAPLVGTVSTAGTIRVTGGPEALLPLADEQLLTDDRPTLIGDDSPGTEVPTADTVLTDTLRKRQLAFSDVHRATSATLAEGEKFARKPPADDLTDPAWTGYTTTAAYHGVSGVTASSSEAELDATSQTRDAGRLPYAALDRDLRTGWRSHGWDGAIGQWLEVRFSRPVRLGMITLALDRSVEVAPVAQIRVDSDAGSRLIDVDPGQVRQTLLVPTGLSSRLRVTVTRLARPDPFRAPPRVGILELTIPGVDAARTLSVPGVKEDGKGVPTAVLSRQGGASPCMHGSYAWACSQRLAIQGDDGNGFDRTIVTQEPGERVITGRAVMTSPGALARQLESPGSPIKVRASSVAVDHSAVGARSAMDGDRRTAWYAHPDDLRPTLTVDLGETKKLSWLRVRLPDAYLGASPMRLTVRSGWQSRTGWVGADGLFTFAPITASVFKLEFTAAARQEVEVIELQVPGTDPLPSLEGQQARRSCGFGPSLEVNGRRVPTEVVGGTLDDLAHGRPVSFRSCARVAVAAGPIRIVSPSTDDFQIQSMAVRPKSSQVDRPQVRMTAAKPLSWTPAERRVPVSTTQESYLIVNENFNVGWRASLAGRVLTPVRLDGWRQAWLLPETASGVVAMTYVPDRPYTWTLAGGGALALLVVLAALIPSRPRAPLRPAGLSAAGLTLVLAGIGLATAGWAGLSVAVAGFLIFRQLSTVAGAEHLRPPLSRLARRMASPWLIPVALAGAWATLGLPVAQLFCLFALALLAAANWSLEARWPHEAA
ncbi:alpha-(1-_3)-arabinofuranosyltransferase domain-containing protein [Nonomuraea soli]|uniref:Arabinofuranan 3-O-arabinosyltransferase n=1 Tax=Nonomuraea soli TaxID=1032476 RepID=A0A7W0HRB6_9ACTN|nr:alpha-(1->3)-arabinofuranosyltransferase family protein [Nonomuraea soli]MBA2892780.1 arabinofuranan 3-O-arabinosyltransferase [Nonomuraea soli]